MDGWMFTQIMDQILRIRSGKHIACLCLNYYSSDFLKARDKDDLHNWKEAQCYDYNEPNQGNWEQHWDLELTNRLLVLFFFFSHCFITTADQLCGRHINQLENYKTFTQQWRGTFTTFNCLQTYRNYRLNGDPQDTEAGLFLLVILLKTTVNIKHLGRKSSVSVFCHLASVISPLGFVLQCPQLQMFSKWFALNLIRPAKHRRIVSVKV